MNTVQNLVERFDAMQRDVFSLRYAQQVISYDGETVAPPKGVDARGEALAVLAAREHELAFGSEAGELLAGLEEHMAELDELHRDEALFFGREYRQMSNIPAHLHADFARLTSKAVSVWKRAKEANDFASFAPYIERIVDSLKEQAACLDSEKDAYDVWLDRFEPGLNRAVLDSFFGTIQSAVSPLVAEIAASGNQPEDGFLHVDVPVASQKLICGDIAEIMGLDLDALAMGETEHPFTDAFSHSDVRIANHFYPHDVMNAVFSLVHEGGHALYEQGIDPRYDYTFLRGGVSMGIHESQSRFMENIVARSEEFCSILLPILRKYTAGQFEGVSSRDLYRAVCKAQPSLIRTEADEVTYPLHVLVRYKIESALFSGEIQASEAAGYWNDAMRETLGVVVPDDSRGILQDTHWSGGAFGYFPSYAVGSAYASQFLRAMSAEFDVYGAVSSGDLEPIRDWLKDRIWRYGCAKQPGQIVQDACGCGLEPDVYVSYLRNKYLDLYGL